MCRFVGFFLCVLFSVVLTDGDGDDKKRKTTTTLLSLGKCSLSVGGEEIDYMISMKGEGEEQYATAVVNLNKELNENYTFKADVEAHNGQTYVHYMDGNGPLCESIDNYGHSAFQRLKGQMAPEITEFCRAPKDTYDLDNYTIGEDELDMPFSTSGKYKVKIQVLDPEGVELACICAEMDVIVEDPDDASSSEES